MGGAGGLDQASDANLIQRSVDAAAPAKHLDTVGGNCLTDRGDGLLLPKEA